jgi:protein-S-isoprenylcysteine O-methyltransferase Ste14
MQAYLAALTLILLIGMVLVRSLALRRKGVRAIHFGNLDRKDFFIPPFALLYLYLVCANAFTWPTVSTQIFFYSYLIAWVGVGLCVAGLLLFFWSLVSFGRSFRVGIDTDHPDKLVKTGAFALSRNPLYVAIWIVLLGQFLVFPNWILLVYLGAATWLLHRQVVREDVYLRQRYGSEYTDYARRVRRYI